jgi:hypothetical protein
MDYSDQDDDNDGLHYHEEWGVFRGNKKQSDFHFYPFFIGSKAHINTVRKRLNFIKNYLGKNKNDVLVYIFVLGMEAAEEKIKESNGVTSPYASLQSKIDHVSELKEIRKQFSILYGEVDGINLTTDEVDALAIELGFNPDDLKSQSYSLELPKSELIRRWLVENVSQEMTISGIRDQMLEDSIIDESENDWNLVKHQASKLGLSSGKRGYWSPAN